MRLKISIYTFLIALSIQSCAFAHSLEASAILGRANTKTPASLQALKQGLSLKREQAKHLFTLGRIQEAIKLQTNLYEILRKSVHPDHPNLWKNYQQLGYYYLMAGKKDAGDQIFRYMIDYHKKKWSEKHLSNAKILDQIAHIYKKTRYYRDAITFFKKALDIRTANNLFTNDITVIENLVELAILRFDTSIREGRFQGNPKLLNWSTKTLEDIDTYLAVKPIKNTGRLVIVIKITLARIYTFRRDYPKSEIILKQINGIFGNLKIQHENPLLFSNFLMNAGIFYSSVFTQDESHSKTSNKRLMALLSMAEEFEKKSIEIHKRHAPDDYIRLSKKYHFIARVYYHQGRRKKAAIAFEKAWNLAQRNPYISPNFLEKLLGDLWMKVGWTNDFSYINSVIEQMWSIIKKQADMKGEQWDPSDETKSLMSTLYDTKSQVNDTIFHQKKK